MTDKNSPKTWKTLIAFALVAFALSVAAAADYFEDFSSYTPGYWYGNTSCKLDDETDIPITSCTSKCYCVNTSFLNDKTTARYGDIGISGQEHPILFELFSGKTFGIDAVASASAWSYGYLTKDISVKGPKVNLSFNVIVYTFPNAYVLCKQTGSGNYYYPAQVRIIYNDSSNIDHTLVRAFYPDSAGTDCSASTDAEKVTNGVSHFRSYIIDSVDTVKQVILLSQGYSYTAEYDDISVKHVAMPDLTVSNITWNVPLRRDRNVTFNITVNNTGDAAAGPFNITFEINPVGATILDWPYRRGVILVPGLAANSGKIVNASLNLTSTHQFGGTAGFGLHDVSAHADCNWWYDPTDHIGACIVNTVVELSENNNKMVKTTNITLPCNWTNFSLSIAPQNVLPRTNVTATLSYNGNNANCTGEDVRIATATSPACLNRYCYFTYPISTSCYFDASISVEPKEYAACIDMQSDDFINFPQNLPNDKVTTAWHQTTACLGNVSLNLLPNPVMALPETVSANVFLTLGPNTLYNYSSAANSDAGIIYHNWKRAEKFTSTGNVAITKLSLNLLKPLNCLLMDRNVTIQIVGNTIGGAPDESNIIATTTITNKELPYVGFGTSWFDVIFSSYPLLSNGVSYWVVVEAQGCGSGIFWKTTTTGGTNNRAYKAPGDSWAITNGYHNLVVSAITPGTCVENTQYLIKDSPCYPTFSQQNITMYNTTSGSESFPISLSAYLVLNPNSGLWYSHSTNDISVSALCDYFESHNGANVEIIKVSGCPPITQDSVIYHCNTDTITYNAECTNCAGQFTTVYKDQIYAVTSTSNITGVTTGLFEYKFWERNRLDKVALLTFNRTVDTSILKELDLKLYLTQVPAQSLGTFTFNVSGCSTKSTCTSLFSTTYTSTDRSPIPFVIAQKISLNGKPSFNYIQIGINNSNKDVYAYVINANVSGYNTTSPICSGTIPKNGFAGVCAFNSPIPGFYEYYACVDKNKNTVIEPGEEDSEKLGVQTCTAGDFDMYINPLVVCNPGHVDVSVIASGFNEYCRGKTIVIRTPEDVPLCIMNIPTTINSTDSYTSVCGFNVPFVYGNATIIGQLTDQQGVTIQAYVDRVEASEILTVSPTLAIRRGWLEPPLGCPIDKICYDYHGFPTCCESPVKIWAEILNTGNIPSGYLLKLNVTPISEDCPGCQEIYLNQSVSGLGSHMKYFGFESIIAGTTCTYTLELSINTVSELSSGGYLDCLNLTYVFNDSCVKYEPMKKWRNVSVMSLPMHFSYAIKDMILKESYSPTPAAIGCSNSLVRPPANTINYTNCCANQAPVCSCTSCNKISTNPLWREDSTCLLTLTSSWQWVFGKGWSDYVRLLNPAPPHGVFTQAPNDCSANNTNYTYPDVFQKNPSGTFTQVEGGTGTFTTIPLTGGCVKGDYCHYETHRVTRHGYSWDIMYDTSVDTYSKEEFVPMYIGNNMSLSIPTSVGFNQLASDICSGDGNLCYTEIPMCGDGLCDVKSGERCWNCDKDCGCADKFCSRCNVPGFTDDRSCTAEYRERNESCDCEYDQCDSSAGLYCDGAENTEGGHCCSTGITCTTSPCGRETWNEEMQTCMVQRAIYFKDMSLTIRKASPNPNPQEFYTNCQFGSGNQNVADFSFTIYNAASFDEVVNITIRAPSPRAYDTEWALQECTVDEYTGELDCPPDVYLNELDAQLITIKYFDVIVPPGDSKLEDLKGTSADGSIMEGFGLNGKKEKFYCVHPNSVQPGTGAQPNIVTHTHDLTTANAICNAINTFGGYDAGYLNISGVQISPCSGCSDTYGGSCLVWPSVVGLCSLGNAQTPCGPNVLGSTTYDQIRYDGPADMPLTHYPGEVIVTPIEVYASVALVRTINDAPSVMQDADGEFRTATSSGNPDLVTANLICDTMHSLGKNGPEEPASGAHFCVRDDKSGRGNFIGDGFFGDTTFGKYGPFKAGRTHGTANGHTCFGLAGSQCDLNSPENNCCDGACKDIGTGDGYGVCP